MIFLDMFSVTAFPMAMRRWIARDVSEFRQDPLSSVPTECFPISLSDANMFEYRFVVKYVEV